MTVKELYDRFDISVRAYNVCISLDLNTIDDLRSYLAKHGNFKNARNCGDKTNDELRGLISEYGNNPNPRNLETQEIMSDFSSDHDRMVFDIVVRDKFDSLSVRARNGLLTLLDNGKPQFELLKDKLFVSSFNPSNLQNVGVLTAKEIGDFRKSILEFYHAIQSENVSVHEKQRIEMNSIVGFNSYSNDYLERFRNREFPLLSFIEKHLKEIFNLSSIDEFILRNKLHLFKERYTLDNIAKKFDLTRERIRQKSIAVLEDIDPRSRALSVLIEKCNYLNLLNEDIILLNDIREPELLRIDINATGSVFAAYFLEVFTKKDFYSFSPLNKFSRPETVQYYYKYDQVKKVKGSYLIRKQVLPKAELLKFYDTVIAKYCERRGEDELLDINPLVNFKLTDEKLQVLSTLVQSEFGITFSGEHISFPRNTNKLVFEYAVEALEKLDKPSHISEILEEVIKIHPEYDSGEEALRGSIGNHKSVFIYFGRSSTYGLKKWENERKNIKGGTIRKMIIEYLSRLDEPMHIQDIVNHVKRYRPTTTVKSVIANLKIESKSFKFFGKGFVGLNNKNYTNTAFGMEIKDAKEIDWEKIIDLVF